MIIEPTWENDHIEVVAEALNNGGIIIFPTDTIYGLGGIKKEALERIFSVKGRPQSKKMALYGGDLNIFERAGIKITPLGQRLAQGFMPGKITLVLSDSKGESTGIRIPDHPWLSRLLLALESPLYGTSANFSGGDDPRDFHQAYDLFKGFVDMGIYSPLCTGGLPSTVIDARGDKPVFLREGAISVPVILDYLEGRHGFGY